MHYRHASAFFQMTEHVASHNKKSVPVSLDNHMPPLTPSAIPPPPLRKHHLPTIAPHIKSHLSHHVRHQRTNHQSWTPTTISVLATTYPNRDMDQFSRQVNYSSSSSSSSNNNRRPPIPNPRPRRRKSRHHALAVMNATIPRHRSSQLAILAAHPAEALCRNESYYASRRFGTRRSAVM
jgi:hypothetical protein